jgi:hypothetical protein
MVARRKTGGRYVVDSPITSLTEPDRGNSSLGAIWRVQFQINAPVQESLSSGALSCQPVRMHGDDDES